MLVCRPWRRAYDSRCSFAPRTPTSQLECGSRNMKLNLWPRVLGCEGTETKKKANEYG